jgi:hypothetical protein
MESREAHQAQMLENDQKMALDRQKAQMAMQHTVVKAQTAAMQPPPIGRPI